MEQRYPRLHQFFGGYLHEDWPIHHGTPERAVDEAIAVATAASRVDLLQQVRLELAALLAVTEEDTRLRVLLNDGLGVNVFFKRPGEARTFANEVERKLMAAVKGQFQASESHDRKF